MSKNTFFIFDFFQLTAYYYDIDLQPHAETLSAKAFLSRELGASVAVIFQFVSTAGRGLFAFTSDGAGVMLPGRHGPWVLEGSILEGQPIPHDLDRATIERAIDADGYQLWRMKGRRGSGKAD